MATFDFPSLQDIVNRMLVDTQNQMPNSNPFLPNSVLLGIITSNAGRYYENNNQIQSLFNALFLTTTVDQFLYDWGSIFGLSQKQATQSTGVVTVVGTSGTVIPIGTVLTNTNGNLYTSTTEGTIASVSLSATVNRIGSTVVVTTDVPHNYATGITVTMSGFSNSEYDGSVSIIVLDDVTFTYQIDTTPSTPDSGLTSADIGTFTLLSNAFGADQNVSSGETLSFQSIVVGITGNVAYPQIEGIQGGQDNETNDEYRERLLFRFRNPVAQFSISAIEQQCFLISGVTRVWVQPITPGVGRVTVYFVRDNDAVIIPTASEILAVRNSILDIYPASSSPSDLYVNAPIPVVTPFTFSSLVPNTATMQQAIRDNLSAFFSDQMGVGDDILQLAYNSAIYNTIDPASGEQVETFSLTTPSGNVNINSNEIGILGDVNFS
jgi:uncharacterized phage protein gp47/JayE